MLRSPVLLLLLSNFSWSKLFLNAWRGSVFVRLCCSSHFRWGQATALVSRRTRCILLFLWGAWERWKWPLQLFLWEKCFFFLWEYQKHTVRNLRCRRMELKWGDAPPGTGRRCLPDSEWMFYSPCPGNPFDCSRRSLRGLALGSHMGSCEASFLFYLSVLPLCCSLSCCVLDFDLQRSLRVSGPATTAGRDPQRACLDGSPPCPLLCVWWTASGVALPP